MACKGMEEPSVEETKQLILRVFGIPDPGSSLTEPRHHRHVPSFIWAVYNSYYNSDHSDNPSTYEQDLSAHVGNVGEFKLQSALVK